MSVGWGVSAGGAARGRGACEEGLDGVGDQAGLGATMTGFRGELGLWGAGCHRLRGGFEATSVEQAHLQLELDMRSGGRCGTSHLESHLRVSLFILRALGVGAARLLWSDVHFRKFILAEVQGLDKRDMSPTC